MTDDACSSRASSDPPTIRRKTSGVTTIVHISDLHFTRATNEKQLEIEYLFEAINGIKADLMVVTGDIIDNPLGDLLNSLWDESDKRVVSVLRKLVSQSRRGLIDDWHSGLKPTFETARDILEKLCDKGHVVRPHGLYIVPGNHDYRLLGNFTEAEISRLIPNVLNLFGLLLKRLPSPLSAENPLFNKVFNQYICSNFIRITDPAGYAASGLTVFCFDSNSPDPLVNFATGFIHGKKIVEFGNKCSYFRERYQTEYESSHKIALVHHHPMPIAATEARESITGRDEFLLLTNSATFMTELIREQIDLVLHGHKHHSSYARAAYPQFLPDARDIAVLAAGSATKTDSDCSFNVIRIGDSGNIDVQHWFRDAARFMYKQPFPLLPYDQVRVRRLQHLIQRQSVPITIERVIAYFEITEAGDMKATRTFKNVRATTNQVCPEYPYVISCDVGMIDKPRIAKISADPQITWKLDKGQYGEREITGRFIFNPAIGQEPVTFSAEWTVYNSHYFEERMRLAVTDGKETTEQVHFRVRASVKQCSVIVQFPESFLPPLPPFVEVYEEGHDDKPEKAYATSKFEYIPESHVAILSIDHPLPYFDYYIKWPLLTEEALDIGLAGTDRWKANQIIEKLMDFAKVVEQMKEPGGAAPVTQGLIEVLGSFYDELLAELAKSLTPAERHREISEREMVLFVADHDQQKLRYVTGYSAHRDDAARRSWAIGEGIAGIAYRRRQACIYTGSPTQAGSSLYVPQQRSRPMHSVLLAIPIFYPIWEDVARKRLVGVITIGSYYRNSCFTRIADEDHVFQAVTRYVQGTVAQRLIDSLIPHQK